MPGEGTDLLAEIPHPRSLTCARAPQKRGRPIAEKVRAAKFDTETGGLEVTPDALACATKLRCGRPGSPHEGTRHDRPIPARPGAHTREGRPHGRRPGPQPTVPATPVRRAPPDGYHHALETQRVTVLRNGSAAQV